MKEKPCGSDEPPNHCGTQRTVTWDERGICKIMELSVILLVSLPWHDRSVEVERISFDATANISVVFVRLFNVTSSSHRDMCKMVNAYHRSDIVRLPLSTGDPLNIPNTICQCEVFLWEVGYRSAKNGVYLAEGMGSAYYFRHHQSSNPAFVSVAQDLQNRTADWKGHPMSGLGALQMFDILSVRRDALVREFYVYLFKEAIICVLEDKKRNQNALGRLLSASGASTSGSPYGGGGSETASLASNQTNSNKPVLRLKGRIYIRHIKRVHDTSTTTELSLTIDMEDERLESFILIFRDRTTLEGWRSVINGLVETLREGSVAGRTKSRERLGNGNAGLAADAVGGRDGRRSPGPPPPAPSHHKTALLNEMEEFGGSLAGGKAGR
ncbi:hypothetical protein FRB99_006935, partial [Tulasnella sp. 403]